MTEADTPTKPAKRRNKIAEQKALLRAELAATVNKVPPAVNAGSIQTTREWMADNELVVVVARGGKARMSLRRLQAVAEKMKGWQGEEVSA